MLGSFLNGTPASKACVDLNGGTKSCHPRFIPSRLTMIALLARGASATCDSRLRKNASPASGATQCPEISIESLCVRCLNVSNQEAFMKNVVLGAALLLSPLPARWRRSMPVSIPALRSRKSFARIKSFSCASASVAGASVIRRPNVAPATNGTQPTCQMPPENSAFSTMPASMIRNRFIISDRTRGKALPSHRLEENALVRPQASKCQSFVGRHSV